MGALLNVQLWAGDWSWTRDIEGGFYDNKKKNLLMLHILPGFSVQAKQNIRHGWEAWAGWEESIVA